MCMHIESGDDETNGNKESKEPPAAQQKVHNILYVRNLYVMCMCVLYVCLSTYLYK